MPHRYCVLLGNGASIAYDASLSIARLTQALRDEFLDLGAIDGEKALRDHARAIDGDDPEGFEDLLGPVEAATEALPALKKLTGFPDVAQVDDSLDDTIEFLGQVHSMGLGFTLELIAGRTKGARQEWHTVIKRLSEDLRGLAVDAGQITVATLNYDGLLHSGLLEHCPEDICDLASGKWRHTGHHRVVHGGPQLEGQRLRTTNNLPDDKLAILQLHGSLGWLQDQDGEIWSFKLDDLRTDDLGSDQSYWKALREQRTDWVPKLVLTNRKNRAVDGQPFALAYEAFRDRLLDSDRWLIAGYGFADVPVNRAFQDAFSEHSHAGDVRLLVVDHEVPDDELKTKVSASLGIPEDQIEVDTSGLPEALNGARWTAWAS